MSEERLRPGEFAQLMLNALRAAEGRRRRRKRDTTPDAIGLSIKHALLHQAAVEDPPPDAFEAWLLGKALAAEASGPVRALCTEILDEYRFACRDPAFARWLRAGAVSADAEAAEEEGARWRAANRLGITPPLDLN
ncbi:MAG TPA: type III secretion fhipep protein [Chloroflexota bacterium]|jgi:hypothetical protein|nr:type III secretion fhipep protein [Chloroflexota bacterium]